MSHLVVNPTLCNSLGSRWPIGDYAIERRKVVVFYVDGTVRQQPDDEDDRLERDDWFAALHRSRIAAMSQEEW